MGHLTIQVLFWFGVFPELLRPPIQALYWHTCRTQDRASAPLAAETNVFKGSEERLQPGERLISRGIR
jgi:hypothetical protein